MNVEKINTHVIDARTRLLEQYREKPKIQALVDVQSEQIQELEDLLHSFSNRLSVHESQGYQLDKIGELVGQKRPPGTDDETYKMFLFAKIGQNTSQGEVERVIQIWKLLTQANLVMIQELFPAGIGINSDSLLPTEYVELALTLIQKVVSAGVKIIFLGTFSPTNAFAFTGVPNEGAFGFGDLNDPEVGGGFASLQISV